MASRILSSCFRRRRSASAVPATPEEMLELEMRLWDVAPQAAYELQKRRHWTPEQVAREAEKQRWVAEQKRLIAKESKRRLRRRRDSGDATTVVALDGAGVDLDKALGEEFETRRFFEELRLQAEARRAASESAAVDGRRCDSSKKVQPLVVMEDDESSDVPARGDEGYLERRRELLGRYCLTPAR
ncbi:hypothetical protein E2562_038421 [Oryza meyeriana var. granulata]|uniref:Uncharacterized protein n=1 Tax=Oryza meyeriana var. granulata TaxID=110450 RepID=A0A6G1BQW7_9ORYZ|nr:hypothetical protein E2562_038421 [Oryza meyeriana var. granulata]